MMRWSGLAAVAKIALVLALPTAVLAQSPGDAEPMAAANLLYESGRHDQAALAYQQLVDAGARDPALYYNLGNAYFKSGETGRAILNYLRAKQASPRDVDVAANLELARAQTADQIETTQQATVVKFVAAALSWLTVTEVGLLSLFLWSLLVALLLAYMFGRPVGRRAVVWRATVVVGVLLAVSAVLFGGQLYFDGTDDDGVIVEPVVDVVSGPGPQYIAEFKLHDGAEVSVLDERGSWARISLPGEELQGWVPATAVDKVALN